MPRPLTEAERRDLLAEPKVAVLSVAAGEGRPPLTMPLWYAQHADGTVSFFTGTQQRRARKTALIKQAGVVSLCVQHQEMPYRYATCEGTVVGIDEPPSAEQMLPIARRYLPEEYARGFVDAELANPTELVLFTIRPDRWLSADFSD